MVRFVSHGVVVPWLLHGHVVVSWLFMVVVSHGCGWLLLGRG